MCCKDWKACWRSGHAFSTFVVAKMGCTDSREETKGLDKETKEDDSATRNAKSILAYGFSTGLKDVIEGRPYKLGEGQNYDLMKDLSANWVLLHQRVDKKAIPLIDDDEEVEFQDTAREKRLPLLEEGEEEEEEEEGSEEMEEDQISQQEDMDALPEESAGAEEESVEELEQARPGLATILGRRR
jgi:hypothetical protein